MVSAPSTCIFPFSEAILNYSSWLFHFMPVSPNNILFFYLLPTIQFKGLTFSHPYPTVHIHSFHPLILTRGFCQTFRQVTIQYIKISQIRKCQQEESHVVNYDYVLHFCTILLLLELIIVTEMCVYLFASKPGFPRKQSLRCFTWE